jgi:hypothetical protein
MKKVVLIASVFLFVISSAKSVHCVEILKDHDEQHGKEEQSQGRCDFLDALKFLLTPSHYHSKLYSLSILAKIEWSEINPLQTLKIDPSNTSPNEIIKIPLYVRKASLLF